jgi:glycosyltransferase involved in cell wall biosynthesis
MENSKGVRDLVLGLPFQMRSDRVGNDLVFGAQVVIEAFATELIKHARMKSLEVFSSPYREKATAKALGNRIQSCASKIRLLRVHNWTTGMRNLDALEISAWCEFGADVVSPFRIRQHFSSRLFPVTVTHHTISYDWMSHSWYLPLLLGNAHACDSVICTSRATKDVIVRSLDAVVDHLERTHRVKLKYQGRLDVLPLGVDVDTFKPRDKRDLRAQLGWPDDAIVMLWVGRISPHDKADLLPLLQAFKSLQQRNPKRKLRLHLAGTPRLRAADSISEYAQALGIENHLVVETTFPPTWRHLTISAADIFVSPVDNVQETFGLAPIEAMACGVPQVVSDWNGYRDTVVDGKTGFRIPTYWTHCHDDLSKLGAVLSPDSIDHLAAAQSVALDLNLLVERLDLLVKNASLRHKMSEESRKRAVSEYGWQQVIRRYERLWCELSQVARRTKYEPCKSGLYQEANLFQMFSGYPTRMLDQEKLELSELGKALVQGNQSLPVYDDEARIFTRDLFEQILVGLVNAAKPMNFNELARAMGRKDAVETAHMRRHAMFLLKYGFLCLANPQSPTRRALGRRREK